MPYFFCSLISGHALSQYKNLHFDEFEPGNNLNSYILFNKTGLYGMGCSLPNYDESCGILKGR